MATGTIRYAGGLNKTLAATYDAPERTLRIALDKENQTLDVDPRQSFDPERIARVFSRDIHALREDNAAEVHRVLSDAFEGHGINLC